MTTTRPLKMDTEVSPLNPLGVHEGAPSGLTLGAMDFLARFNVGFGGLNVN